jgi:hypothetical protein
MRHKIMTAILLLALLVTVGCKPTVRPDETVKNFLDAMVNSDFETAVKFTGGVNPQYELDRILMSRESFYGSTKAELEHTVLGLVKYRIMGTEITGERAEAEVKVSAPDCKSIASKALNLMYLMASINPSFQHCFQQELNGSNVPVVTSTVTVALDKKDGLWVVDLRGNDALLNALTGNMGDIFGS